MIAEYQVKYAISRGDLSTLRPCNGTSEPAPQTSKRFITTTREGTELVAARLDEVPGRQQMAQELRERKLRNNRTSIVLGSGPGCWQTDAQMRQKDILNAPARGLDVEANKVLKQQLTRTNFSFGDEAPSYERVNLLPDPTGHISEYTGVLNEEVKNLIKKSNMYFGNSTPNYTSVAHSGMAAGVTERGRGGGAGLGPSEGGNGTGHGGGGGGGGIGAGEGCGGDEEEAVFNRQHASQEPRTVEQTRRDNAALKQALTKTTLTFGEEKTDWTTDYQRGFTYDGKRERDSSAAALAKEVKDDLRRSHFSFGSDKTSWETDAHRSMRSIEGEGGPTPEQRLSQKKKNRELKANLQTTNYEIGFDDEYQ